MARARNIKPAFFSDDELSELSPITRLYFIGLWTICDFRGCLEYRPKRIKALILPYDDVDIETITINLDKARFIRMYSVQGKRYLKIVNFTKHQNPHKNEREAGSEIPDFVENDQQVLDLKELTINPDKIGTTLDCDGSDRADSLIPHPDSPNPITDTNTKHIPPDKPEDEPKKSKYKFTDEYYQLAVELSNPVKQRFSAQSINLDEWADAIRKLVDIDKYTIEQIYHLWRWRTDHQGNNGFTWADNIRTPMKLRQKKDGLSYFEILKNQMRVIVNENNQGFNTSGRPSLVERVAENGRQFLRDKGIIEEPDEYLGGETLDQVNGDVRT